MAQEQSGKGRNTVLSPTINIQRSPLWGRSDETFGEDPILTSRMAVAQILGIQGSGLLSVAKHFAVYNQEFNRNGAMPEKLAVNTVVDRRALHEIYLPAFKAAVQEADVAGVLCSYNRVNGEYACENSWLLNETLKSDWGFEGFVVSDWGFATRSSVGSALAGLDISMPGTSYPAIYGFPEYYGPLLATAVQNGSISQSRIDDMAERIWRYMFKLGVVDKGITGSEFADVRTNQHLSLAQTVAEDGTVLLKNDQATLPISATKYANIAVFGADATNAIQISETNGGYANTYSNSDVKAPFDALRNRGAVEGISVQYATAYPNANALPIIDSSYFKDGGLNVSYWTTADWTGPINQTDFVPNITTGFPAELYQVWDDVFSCVYQGTLLPNTSGVHHFSLDGSGDALLYVDEVLITNISQANFETKVQGVANLTAGSEHNLTLKYFMTGSILGGDFGVTFGMNPGNQTRDLEADALAANSDLSVIFVSDRFSEGMDNTYRLSLPGDQDAVISRLAGLSKKTVVVINSNTAVLMPWISEVDAVLESWYSGQEIGLALERLFFGDISPSGKLPVTFPKTLDDAIQITDAHELEYTEGLNIGYRAYDANSIEPLFYFGHGLTYSEFELTTMTVKLLCNKLIEVNAILANVGTVKAREVVQLYVSYPEAAAEPPKLLKGFQKIELKPFSKDAVSFQINMDDLRVWDELAGDWRFVEGEYTFMLGFSAGDIKVSGSMIF